MSLTLAGYTFTSPLAAEWAALDDHLYGMDTYGRQANWSAVESYYAAPFAPAGQALSDFLAPAPNDSGPLDLLYYYYGADEAKEFVSHATWGTGFAAGWDDVSRREMLTKGSAYRNVLYRVWQLLSEGVQSCASASVPAGAGAAAAGLELPVPGVYEWERRGRRSPAARRRRRGRKGYSIYALGDKRCRSSRPASAGRRRASPRPTKPRAPPRRRHHLHFGRQLRATLPASDPAVARACLGALAPQRAFKSASLVGLVQGTLERRTGSVRPDGHGKVEVADRRSRRLLPLIAECGASVGETIHANMWLNADVNVGTASPPSRARSRACTAASASRAPRWAACSATTASTSPASSRAARRRRRRRAAAGRRRRVGMTTAASLRVVLPACADLRTPGGVALMVLTVIFGLLTIALTVQVLVMANGRIRR